MLVPPPRTASGRRVYDATDLRILVWSGGGASLAFRKSARGYGLADLRKRLVARLAKSPRITLTTFEQSSAILKSWNVCCREPFRVARVTLHRTALCWTFSISSVSKRRMSEAVHSRHSLSRRVRFARRAERLLARPRAGLPAPRPGVLPTTATNRLTVPMLNRSWHTPPAADPGPY